MSTTPEHLIAVGEIDTHGRFFIDSYFWHRHNAESFALHLLKRGAYRVVIDGVVLYRSRLAQEMDMREMREAA